MFKKASRKSIKNKITLKDFFSTTKKNGLFQSQRNAIDANKSLAVFTRWNRWW